MYLAANVVVEFNFLSPKLYLSLILCYCIFSPLLLHPIHPSSLICTHIPPLLSQCSLAPMVSVSIATHPPTPQRLLDLSPYNFLSLSCSAEIRVRSRLVPFNLIFEWQRSVGLSAPLEVLPPSTFTNKNVFGSTATSVLSINTTMSGNHTYLCRVVLYLSPAPDIIKQDSSQTITVYGELM